MGPMFFVIGNKFPIFALDKKFERRGHMVVPLFFKLWQRYWKK